jgi:NADH:ubiquinone oxidoreductase subunit E
MAEKVEIQWKRCLGYCNSNIGKALYVIINDEVICEATLPRIIEKIELALSNH